MFLRRIQCGIQTSIQAPTKTVVFFFSLLFFLEQKQVTDRSHYPFPTQKRAETYSIPPIAAASSTLRRSSPLPPRPRCRLRQIAASPTLAAPAGSIPPASRRRLRVAPLPSMVSFSAQSSSTLGFSGRAAGRGFGTPRPRCACSSLSGGRL